MEARMTKKSECFEAASSHVWTDFDKFVTMCAKEHAIANMGQSFEDLAGYGANRPELIVEQAFSQLRNDCESDEMADGVWDEYKSWVKQAKKDATRVQKAGLPLTLANARLAFENKGPFAKKTK
jgi:uncharacterized protein YifE (UPF0438 family)